MSSTYCDIAPDHEWHGPYHNTEYGFPPAGGAALLKKREAFRRAYGGFEWVKLFKRTFRFTGGEIVGEFLMSIGYLQGAHVESCPVHRRILRLRPPWAGRRASSKAPASAGAAR